MAQLEAGTLFAGRYVVEGELGVGGMGAVYRVFDRALGERVALKTLLPRPDDPALAERLRQEVRLARRVTHSNVVRTFDFGQHAGVDYLTMELLSGPTLRKVMAASGRVDATRAIGIALQLCAGLGAAHAVGIVHSDLKPQNIVVENDARVVILDFGIARSVGEAQLSDEIAGSPAYMAPEVLSGEAPGFPADLFALGLILHELLSGRLPSWNGVERDPIARVGGVRPSLALRDQPHPVVDLVTRLLDPDPARRPESVDAVATTLSGIDVEATARVRDLATASTVSFAPLPDAGRALAVLPFAERNGDGRLGRDLACELTDVLARTRGLRVLASPSGSTGDADPRQVAQKLGADWVVSGTLETRGETLLATARLIEVGHGVQIWTERFEGELADAMVLLERTAQRIAEALRLELALHESRGVAPALAMQLYLDARRAHRQLAEEAFETACRAVELAPRFQPALSIRALAGVRRIFSYCPSDRPRVEQAVSEALERAPELPETQLAAAILASYDADYATAARLLRNAVTVAPTFADAHEYLGLLQLEAGRTEEGARRLELVMHLDPVSPLAVSLLARHAFLTGSDQLPALRAELARRTGGAGPTLAIWRLREALWSQNAPAVIALRHAAEHPTSAARLLHLCATIVEGASESVVEAEVESTLRQTTVPRFATFVHQLAAEAWCLSGHDELGLRHVERAASAALVDIEWLERCPSLERLRSRSQLVTLANRARERARAVWLA